MLTQLQQMSQQSPEQQQQLQPQIQELTQKIESRKAVLISEISEDFMKEEKKITSQFDHDPLLKLKSREVDLKAMDTVRKQEELEQKKAVEQAKILSREGIEDEKLDQNEELAIMRADTSLTKQEMADENKRIIARMKAKDVNTLKGPKS
jgi:predicted O-linked N-acetylglucosamine transferase (SPINDLY family)